MNSSSPFTLRALTCTVTLGLAIAGGDLGANDWQGLIGNSPFGQVPQNTPPPAAAQLEFRGMVQEDDVVLVNVFNVSTQKSQWIPLDGEANGIAVQRYDAAGDKLEVTMGGKPMTLALKQSRVVLAQAAPVPAPNPQGAPVPAGGNAAGGGNPGQGGADAQQALRNLPPEARSMIDEIRRRRALRSQQAQQAAGGATPNAQPARTN